MYVVGGTATSMMRIRVLMKTMELSSCSCRAIALCRIDGQPHVMCNCLGAKYCLSVPTLVPGSDVHISSGGSNILAVYLRTMALLHDVHRFPWFVVFSACPVSKPASTETGRRALSSVA